MTKLRKTYKLVYKFIDNLKYRVAMKKDFPYCPKSDSELNLIAYCEIIRKEQNKYFGEIVDFFSRRDALQNTCPSLVLQMNLFPDRDNLLRVKGKFSKGAS